MACDFSGFIPQLAGARVEISKKKDLIHGSCKAKIKEAPGTKPCPSRSSQYSPPPAGIHPLAAHLGITPVILSPSKSSTSENKRFWGMLRCQV